LSLLSQVSASLLAPNDLDEGRLQQLLGSLMSHQVEFGDLYFQRSWHESCCNNRLPLPVASPPPAPRAR